MGKHIFDHQRISKAGRLVHFLAIAHALRSTWHRAEANVSNVRTVQFCRIARGRLT